MRRISDYCLEMIKNFEGLYLSTYRCPAGVLTIGYGHTGEDVKPGLQITKEQAETILKEELKKLEVAINKYVKVPLTQNQFDALVSWVYNVGIGALLKSTLLKYLNIGRYDLIPNELKRWNKVKGKVLNGLATRRNMEAKLFQTKDTTI